MIYKNTKAIEAVNNGVDMPDVIRANGYVIGTLEYKQTDGWRGYNYIVPAQGFKLLDSDWITGDWDDAPAGHSQTEQQARIEALEQEHGDLYVVYSPTSNVFSSSMDLLVRDTSQQPTKKRKLEGKRLANNTRLVTDADGNRAVRLHKTNIATELPGGKLRIDTGGWDTMTTRARIHEFTNLRCWRDKGVTYIDGHKLEDGMIIAGALNLSGQISRATAFPRS